MLESRVIKRCYPRFSVPSHLYTRNAYVEETLRFARGLSFFIPESREDHDGPGDCPSSKKKDRSRREGIIIAPKLVYNS